MLKIRQALHPYLKSLHDNIYFQQAPDTAEFPYAVYNITSILDDGEATKEIILEIDGWTNQSSTTALENMMADINGLNKAVITTDDLVVVFYLENKAAFIEDETKYHRRRFSYVGKMFEKE